MPNIREIKMSLSDVGANNNKYWSGIVTDSNEVLLEWGRIGDTLQSKRKSFDSEYSANSFLDGKVKEKKRKGYTELNILSGSGTVVVNHDKGSLKEIAKSQIVSDDETKKLIEKLTEANIHNILTSTTLTYSQDTGLFATPLGIVTDISIKEARQKLNLMSPYVEQSDFENSDYIELLNSFLRLIPQKVGRKLRSDIFGDLNAIKAQNDIIDSLEVSYQQAITDTAKPKNDQTIDIPQVFSCELNLINDIDIINRIDRLYKSTLQNIHSSSNLKLKKVYNVKIDSMHDNFEKHGRKLGNVMELFHGTKTSNLLSILKSGLIIPPVSSPLVCGRMFGPGIYLSDQSSKALNYSQGYWSGTRNNNCFMFLADVSMGKSYTPKSSSESLPKPGYDSTFAKGGYSGVINNEMIVPNLYQVNLKYLLEFDL